MKKEEVRKQIRALLNTLPQDTIKEKTKKIHNNLFLVKQWKEASVIGITMSMGKEVDTYSIIERAWEEKKTVVVPRCNRQTHELVFRKLTTFSQLEETFFGLKEPIEEETERWEQEIDLLLVPGVVFTKKGERIGYGGGYYDRYLNSHNSYLISICFEIQIIKYIETESHDKNVMIVITEDNIYK
ncbi:MAG: 5-formyltetrahydrofolate cyclo-ligase [Bacillaceae bacterium]